MNYLKEGYTELYVGHLLDEDNHKNILRVIHMANRLGLEGKAITEVSAKTEANFDRTRWFYIWRTYSPVKRILLILTGRM